MDKYDLEMKKTILQDNIESVATLAVRMDSIKDAVTSIDEKIDDVHITLKEHNGRLRAMEQWRNFVLGCVAVISVCFVPIGIYAINKLVTDKISDSTLETVVTRVVE